MKLKSIIAITACTAILIGASTAVITKKQHIQERKILGVIPDLSEQELILNSDIIVEATVTNIAKSHWSNPENIEEKRNVLQTDITLNINNLLSGEYDDKTVVVRINKGYDPESKTRVISDGYPDFSKGEHVILFLSRDDSDIATEENYFVLTGMRQGKWLINETSSRTTPSIGAGAPDTDLTEDSIESLKQTIAKEKANNPDWKEKKAQQAEETKKINAELFGE